MCAFVLQIKKLIRDFGIAAFVITGMLDLLEFEEFAAGLAGGAVVGITYLMMMGYRVKKAVGFSPGKAVSYMRNGWLIRLSFIVLAVMFSVQFPQIHVLGVLAGLFLLHVVIFFHAAMITMRPRDKWPGSNIFRKGEK